MLLVAAHGGHQTHDAFFSLHLCQSLPFKKVGIRDLEAILEFQLNGHSQFAYRKLRTREKHPIIKLKSELVPEPGANIFLSL